jgi:hypothetical protein
VEDSEIPRWCDKLLSAEPYLDATNTLPERL